MEISVMHPGKWENRNGGGRKSFLSFPKLIESSSSSLSNDRN